MECNVSEWLLGASLPICPGSGPMRTESESERETSAWDAILSTVFGDVEEDRGDDFSIDVDLSHLENSRDEDSVEILDAGDEPH
jgi:hypothetical protein